MILLFCFIISERNLKKLLKEKSKKPKRNAWIILIEERANNMKTWNDYKEYAKKVDSQAKNDIEEMEELASIVGAIIEKRNALGLSQRQLAEICGIPQSSVARIETLKTIPNLDTLIKIMQPLGLKLTVSVA